jgi:hypothetical protein
VGFLEGDLRDSIFAAFQGRLLSGEVRRKSGATSGGTDAHGDPLDIDTAQWLVEGFIDTYSRTLRAAAGIPDSAVKVCIFAGSAPDYSPHANDLVRLGERWTRLEAGPFDIDPAGALWTCQAEIVEAPQ